ncbi:hypothetical protein Cgig2_015981 [Carnegiea gigantea]|uniref:Pectinesterase inhibitor domain-containing protein n=1 Tax=Carnegiea gigantea TaxID=171969 RepID=A0A9Q1KM87_9CARY|nr:hypothetical protein Cgig2_015981 [Carnegiea gigantea]
MEYDRLKPTTSFRVTDPDPPDPRPRPKIRARLLILIAGILLVIAAACAVGVEVRKKSSSSGGRRRGPTGAIRKACGLTRYPDLCMATLMEFPGAEAAKDPKELAHVSVNMTLQRFGQALSESSEIQNWGMDSMSRSAYQDCLELLEDSVDLLSQCLSCLSVEQQSQRGDHGRRDDMAQCSDDESRHVHGGIEQRGRKNKKSNRAKPEGPLRAS